MIVLIYNSHTDHIGTDLFNYYALLEASRITSKVTTASKNLPSPMPPLPPDDNAILIPTTPPTKWLAPSTSCPDLSSSRIVSVSRFWNNLCTSITILVWLFSRWRLMIMCWRQPLFSKIKDQFQAYEFRIGTFNQQEATTVYLINDINILFLAR